jgi:uncharacterized protein YaaW (UPF0174 family)
MHHFRTDDRAAAVTAWLGVALFFVVGDVVTTYTGFAVGAVESNPTAAGIVTVAGFVGVIAAKLFVVTFAWVCYRRAEVYRVTLPASLAVAGIVITAWNTAVVAVLLIR